MNINVTQEGAKTEFAIEGRLDTTTSPQLEEFVNDLYAKGVTDIEVDMASCDFVSSAGLRVLLTAKKATLAAGQDMSVVNANETVRGVFEITGCGEMFGLV